ncbi:oncoprotein-induced transcript 3 protein-like [Diadema setosum]|uniref:oncoprotein-induced transcript 3 protein-like n=1 Tax=Diadema setosum TaxID=31175 RepID=UPI003B3A4699
MTLILSRHLLAPDEDGTDVHFTDESCVGYNHDSEHIAITTRYDLCSTKHEQLDDDMVYSNVVTYYRPRPEADDAKQVITREHYLRIPVKCILERKQLLSEMFTPQLGEVTFEEVGFGEFTLTLQRYEDEKFDIVANDSALIPLGTEIFFGVELTSVSGLTLFIDSCWATPSTDPLDTLKYVLFEEGCAKDQTVRFFNNLGTLTLKGFQVDAFAFLGDYSQVFVHCSVLVCDAEDSGSRCLQGCLSRRKRGLGGTGSQSTPHTISLGPFYEDHSPNHADNNAAEAVGRYPSTATVATIGSVGIVIALVALLVVMVNRGFRNRPGSLGYRQVAFEPTSLE